MIIFVLKDHSTDTWETHIRLSDTILIGIVKGHWYWSTDLVSLCRYTLFVCDTHTSLSSIEFVRTKIFDGWINDDLRKWLHIRKWCCRSTVDDEDLERMTDLYCWQSDTITIVGESLFELCDDSLYCSIWKICIGDESGCWSEYLVFWWVGSGEDFHNWLKNKRFAETILLSWYKSRQKIKNSSKLADIFLLSLL